MLNIPSKNSSEASDSAIALSAPTRPSGAPLTRLLVLMLVGAAMLLLWAGSSLSSARDSSLAAGEDLGVCREYLADLDRWNAGPSSASAPAAGESVLAGRLSTCAAEAGIASNVASVEPGQPSPVRDTDFTQTPVFVRVNAVSVRQLVTFLHGLSAGTSTIRTMSIELSPSPEAVAVPEATTSKSKSAVDELWTADITLAYLTYTPREKSR